MSTQGKIPTEIWVFDVDGVITDPATKTVLHSKIIELIEQRLQSKTPICLNTGRSAEWIKTTIISHFKANTPLEYLFSACEMGNVTLQFDEHNQAKEEVHNQDLIPPQLSQTIREIVMSSYGDSMFIDETKKSILTVEMKDHFSQDAYEELQSKLSGEIRIILKNYHPGIHVRPSSSSIAIDVKPITSNKELGAKQILMWLQARKIDVNSVCITAFGDSLSDFQMSEFFASSGLTTKFVYVGEDKISPQTKYTTVITKAHYSAGTLEYLKG
jgi:hydroxymethylpyrimidine pyrophosphatase-like HAD family hydrolase